MQLFGRNDAVVVVAVAASAIAGRRELERCVQMDQGLLEAGRVAPPHDLAERVVEIGVARLQEQRSAHASLGRAEVARREGRHAEQVKRVGGGRRGRGHTSVDRDRFGQFAGLVQSEAAAEQRGGRGGSPGRPGQGRGSGGRSGASGGSAGCAGGKGEEEEEEEEEEEGEEGR